MIERYLREGMEADYYRASRQLKQKASHMKGYISGEMLVDPENQQKCLILATWDNLESWQNWAKTDVRIFARDSIRVMLTEDEKISVYQAASIVN